MAGPFLVDGGRNAVYELRTVCGSFLADGGRIVVVFVLMTEVGFGVAS
jgi:hypothetical protein